MEEKQGNEGKFTINQWSLNFWTPLNMDVLLDTIYLDRMDMKKRNPIHASMEDEKGRCHIFSLIHSHDTSVQSKKVPRKNDCPYERATR